MAFLTKRFFIALIGCSFLLALSACASQSDGQSSGPYSNSNSISTAAATEVLVKVAQVNVKGTTEAVLTDANGMTLYTFKPDTTTKTACVKACAVTWPPLLTKQTLEVKLNNIGSLSAINDANGIQVQASNHFLYRFSKDTAPGQANGQGIAGKWFVATPSNG